MYKYVLMAAICYLVTTPNLNAQAYQTRGEYNRLGIQGKYVLYDILTDDLDLTAEGGPQVGLAARGRFFNQWGLIYGVDFFTVNFEVQDEAQNDLDYNLIGVQLNLWPSYNIIEEHLSIEAGPTLQVNSNLRLRGSGQGDTVIDSSSNLTASSLQEISRVLPLVGVGISGGFKRVFFTLQYQFGFTNIFGGLDSQNIDINGNVSAISGGIIVMI